MSELREYIREIRKLRLIMYLGDYDSKKILKHIETLDSVFINPRMSELKEMYTEEFRSMFYHLAINNKEPSRDDLREGRALLTEMINSIFDILELRRQ